MQRGVFSAGLVLLALLGCGGREGDGETDSRQRSAGAVEATSANVVVKSGAFIEYTVTGDVELSDREEEVVLCSNTSDGFQAHTIGAWNFTLDADGSGPGSHGVRLRVAAPQEIAAVHASGTDNRFYGDGMLTIEDAGKDNVGFPAVRVHFTADGLESRPGHRISVAGSLFCGLL